MKLGLMSAPLPHIELEDLAQWASKHGFEMLELACWPVGEVSGGIERASHINVEDLTPKKAGEINEMLGKYGLEISSLGYYSNPLHPDPAQREQIIEHLKKVILAAEMLDVDIVGSFVGRVQDESVEANLQYFKEVWPPIVRFAGMHNTKIAIENCPMVYRDEHWPGGRNLAYSPAIWRKMFEIIPDENFGLNYDPSHLVWQLIDYIRPIYEFRDRIFHFHAKDTRIDAEALYQDGILGLGMSWEIPTMPGLGEIVWPKVMEALYSIGYDFVISVEHGGPTSIWEESEAEMKRGFLIARNTLAPLIA